LEAKQVSPWDEDEEGRRILENRLGRLRWLEVVPVMRCLVIDELDAQGLRNCWLSGGSVGGVAERPLLLLPIPN